MSRLVGDTVDILVARTRQSGSIAVTDDFATQLLTLCQQVANIALRRIFVSETFDTVAERLLYPITDLTTAVDIVSMTDPNNSDIELHHCPTMVDFAAYDLNWFRKVDGTRFDAWTQLSRDYFIIYPAKAAASTIDITSVKFTTLYTDYSALTTEAMELPDEDVEIALKLAEMFLMLRQRKPETMEAELSLIMRTIKEKRYGILKS